MERERESRYIVFFFSTFKTERVDDWSLSIIFPSVLYEENQRTNPGNKIYFVDFNEN